MTAGEGGFVVTNNDRYAHHMKLFVDGVWESDGTLPNQQVLAMNYRMTELQGAVALAQFDKVERVIQARVKNAALMDTLISGLTGVSLPATTPHSRHVYLKYPLGIDEKEVPGGVDEISRLSKERGIWSAPGYIRKPAFMSKFIREQRTFGDSGFSFRGPHRRGLPAIKYRLEDYPGATEALARVLRTAME